MIKNIIFDLDGVLFDSLELHRTIYLDALRSIRPYCPIDDEYFIKNLDSMSTKSRTSLLVSQGFLNYEEGERVCKLKQEMTANKLKEYVFFKVLYVGCVDKLVHPYSLMLGTKK